MALSQVHLKSKVQVKQARVNANIVAARFISGAAIAPVGLTKVALSG